MPWPVYLALKQLFPSGRRVPLAPTVDVNTATPALALLRATDAKHGTIEHHAL